WRGFATSSCSREPAYRRRAGCRRSARRTDCGRGIMSRMSRPRKPTLATPRWCISFMTPGARGWSRCSPTPRMTRWRGSMRNGRASFSSSRRMSTTCTSALAPAGCSTCTASSRGAGVPPRGGAAGGAATWGRGRFAPPARPSAGSVRTSSGSARCPMGWTASTPRSRGPTCSCRSARRARCTRPRGSSAPRGTTARRRWNSTWSLATAASSSKKAERARRASWCRGGWRRCLA
ncbi:MAG: NAD-dependent protein deacetylase of SIR2 family, partial [uncultured Sphingomonas sp.]